MSSPVEVEALRVVYNEDSERTVKLRQRHDKYMNAVMAGMLTILGSIPLLAFSGLAFAIVFTLALVFTWTVQYRSEGIHEQIISSSRYDMNETLKLHDWRKIVIEPDDSTEYRQLVNRMSYIQTLRRIHPDKILKARLRDMEFEYYKEFFESRRTP